MKISSKILSIPPYLSTTWDHVSSLHIKENGHYPKLIVLLDNQTEVEIPGLGQEILDAIFEAHTQYLEDRPSSVESILSSPTFGLKLPLQEEGGLLNSFSSSMTHNPEQANLPPIPETVLSKIITITKSLGLDDLSSVPEPEPNCHCMFCQISKALHKTEEEEIVSDEELTFRSNWDVVQSAEKLYVVTNTLDENESYNVFLGSPLGCTCGNKNCEHIKAVLTS